LTRTRTLTPAKKKIKKKIKKNLATRTQRGSYVASTKFADDDGTVHLEYNLPFAIAKAWE
jgi:hypothetical protein